VRYFLYSLLLTLLTPFGALYLLLSRKYRPLLRRFRPSIPSDLCTGSLWIHACSVGEVFLAKVIIDALQLAAPRSGILLTVSTLSGMDLAKRTLPRVPLTFLPMDTLWSVRPFVKKLRPALLVLMETELWPTLIRETKRQGAPVIILNGRLSNDKYDRLKKYRWLIPSLVSMLDHAAVQAEDYRQRFIALGLTSDRVSIMGNLKFDGALKQVTEASLKQLRQCYGYKESDKIIVFGSTHSGEEALALDCWKLLKQNYPDLKLVIAPRHLQRLDQVIEVFRNEQATLRSTLPPATVNEAPPILILDRMGELAQIYALGSVAVIGGSFFPASGGHNPLESVALGVPTLFGPHMDSFADVVSLLVNGGGALQLASHEELASVVKELLVNKEMHQRVAHAGRMIVQNNQGAAACALNLLQSFLEPNKT